MEPDIGLIATVVQAVLAAAGLMLQVGMGAAALVIAIIALHVAQQQLKPLLKDIRRLAEEQQRRQEWGKLELENERSLLGFDPRFDNWEWKELLAADGAAPRHLRLELSRTYSDFHLRLPDNLRGRKGPAVVDLLYVPKLLHQGHIEPLTGDFGLDEMLEQRVELKGGKLEEPVLKMLRAMCSDADERIGALPLWINSHGRMIGGDPSVKGGERISQISSFDRLLKHEQAEEWLTEAGVQSNYLIFEFWAHAHYRGCTPFRRVAGQRRLTSPLLDPGQARERRAFAEAVADLAVRLRFFRITGENFVRARYPADLRDENAFALEHSGDARLIRHGVALWKPVFSTELLWHALPTRDGLPGTSLVNEKEFKPPFAEHAENSWRYLSALGGYGLVLPRGAASDQDSVRALKHVFLRNPRIMHPYLLDMLPTGSGSMEVEAFVDIYARPRLPVWPEVEAVMGEMLCDLMLLLPRDRRGTPWKVWCAYVAVLAESDKVTRCIQSHFLELAQTLKCDGWTFAFGSAGLR